MHEKGRRCRVEATSLAQSKEEVVDDRFVDEEREG